MGDERLEVGLFASRDGVILFDHHAVEGRRGMFVDHPQRDREMRGRHFDQHVRDRAVARVVDDHVRIVTGTVELDSELTKMFIEGINLRDMAKHFGRTKGAIRSRIRKLELDFQD